MKRYRLAFAVAKYFPYGGMQRSMRRIAEECDSRGHTVEIFTGKWEGNVPDNITVNEIKIRALTNPGKNDELAEKLSAAVVGGNYDCIVGFTKISGLDIYYAGDPCFAAKFAETKPASFRYLPRYRSFLRQEKEVFGAVLDIEILLISHQEQEKFIKYYGTGRERFHLLPPGINQEQIVKNIPGKIVRLSLRDELGVSGNGFLLVLVGSGFRTKGVDRAIRALSSLPKELKEKCRLVVIGKGSPKSYLRLSNKLSVATQVHFAGVRDDTAQFYYSADLLLHPARTENTGTTLIEAMICGLPVLATENCGFAHHIVDAGAGLICPAPFSQENLNSILLEMLTSEQRRVWQERGPDYCKRTDLYSLIERAADVIIARAERNNRQKAPLNNESFSGNDLF
jgi:UDP-glucose:(heptosyl)LPS alpha-1,3-glucosyltransferase